MNISLSIIIISYKTCDLTLACLESVFRETLLPDYETIVLDNGSDDGSVEAISKNFDGKVRLISLENNIGFAAGNNYCANVVSGEYILLLNPDTVILEHAIDQLMNFAHRNPGAGIWGGNTVFGDGSLNAASCWSRQTCWSLFCQALGLTTLFRKSYCFNPEGIGGWNHVGERYVDIVSGCFLLIRKSLWETLNGFREEFFMYGEEADLCLRARALGARPMVTSAATIIHYGGASERIRADKIVRLLKAKNLLICFHFTVWLKWLGVNLLFLWPLSRYVAHSILSVFGRRSSRETADIWYEVLRRKSEWFIPPRNVVDV